jgi:hypothetical protein
MVDDQLTEEDSLLDGSNAFRKLEVHEVPGMVLQIFRRQERRKFLGKEILDKLSLLLTEDSSPTGAHLQGSGNDINEILLTQGAWPDLAVDKVEINSGNGFLYR